MRATLAPALLAGLLLSIPINSSAQGVTPLTIAGSRAEALLQLPGGLAVDLALEFEQVLGLTPTALEVSASVVAPSDVSILGRMPSLATIIPGAFPVLIRIEPSPASALSFSGVVTISLHTHNLSLDPAAPLGLFSAANGGPFREITGQVAVGSYRVNGSGGGFSEFIIARDGRPIDDVIAAKFERLDQLLTEHEAVIPSAALSRLRQHLFDARALSASGLTVQAIAQVAAFGDVVRGQGTAIPDVWRAHDARVNVAGALRAAALTLRFSLTLKANAQ